MVNIKEALPGIQENVPLKNFTSFKIGGPAKYFFIARSKEDIIQAISVAKINSLPFFILSGGSNLLVSDNGFAGLIIKTQNTKHEIQDTAIRAEAGVPLALLVNEAVKNSLTGLEWASGIPGTLGGAIYGNAGTPDLAMSMKNIADSVEALDTNDLIIKNFSNQDCYFNYRDSIFKKQKNLIILSAVLHLKKGDAEKIKERMKEFISQRQKKQPLNFPSAGSVFKNPPNYSAGELIEKCGLKGRRIGNAQISEKHANFIVNLGDAKAGDVKKLIELIKKEVKNNFGTELEEEIQFLGF